MGVRTRFAVAVVAGLLLGVVIIASSAYYPANQVAGPASFERAQVTLTLTTTYAAATTQAGAAGSTTSNPFAVTSTTVTTTAANPLEAAPAFDLPVSQVQSMAQRSPESSLLAVLPIVAGAVLGLVFYRTVSSREKEESTP